MDIEIGDLIVALFGPMMVIKQRTIKRLECKDNNSNKFWEIQLDGSTFITRYGRIGSIGSENISNCNSESKAKTEYDRIIKQKLTNGYKEIGDIIIYVCLIPGHKKKYINYSKSEIDKLVKSGDVYK